MKYFAWLFLGCRIVFDALVFNERENGLSHYLRVTTHQKIATNGGVAAKQMAKLIIISRVNKIIMSNHARKPRRLRFSNSCVCEYKTRGNPGFVMSQTIIKSGSVYYRILLIYCYGLLTKRVEYEVDDRKGQDSDDQANHRI